MSIPQLLPNLACEIPNSRIRGQIRRLRSQDQAQI
jgi:hypothetical protein